MNYPPEEHQGLPRVRQYLGVLLARRWLVLAVLVVSVGVVALLTFTQAPVYRGTSRLLIEAKKPQAVGIREVYEATDSNRDYYETQYRLLRDRHLAERVFGELGVGERSEYAAAKDPVGQFMQCIQIEPIRGSRLVDVGFDDTRPEWAGRVANALVSAYIDENQRREITTAERALRELTRQAQEIEPKFRACSAAIQAFKEKTDLITVEGEEKSSNIVLDRLARLNEAATVSELRRVASQTEYEAAERFLAAGGDLGSLPIVVESETVRKLTLDLVTVQQEQSQVMQRYLPKHPRAQSIAARMAVLEGSLQTERQRLLDGMRAKFDRAKAEEAVLQVALTQQKQEALNLSRLAMQHRILKDEADRVGRLYDIVLARIKEIDLTSEMARQGSNVFIIDEARVPEESISPRKRVNLALAAVAGLVLGIGLAFFFEHLDTTIKDKHDVETALSLPVLGFVPSVKANGDGVSGPGLSGVRDSASAVAEAFRTIRTGITFSAATKKMKRLLVTSACPREGKTLVSVNTAAALARGGAKVLLIDSDMRRPCVHKIFGIRPKTGLASYLVANNGDLTLEQVVYPTEVPNLDILPCDRTPPNPAELLGSARMKALVREAAKKYDRIVFDSPPIVRVADASILSAVADGVLLVVRAFNTDRHLAQRSKEVLESVDSKIIGVVVNDVDARKHSGYYGYGYRAYGYHAYGYHPYGRQAEDKDGASGDGAAAQDGASGEAAPASTGTQALLLLAKGEKR